MATTLKLFRTMALLKVARGVDFEGKRSDGNGCLKMKVAYLVPARANQGAFEAYATFELLGRGGRWVLGVRWGVVRRLTLISELQCSSPGGSTSDPLNTE